MLEAVLGSLQDALALVLAKADRKARMPLPMVVDRSRNCRSSALMVAPRSCTRSMMVMPRITFVLDAYRNTLQGARGGKGYLPIGQQSGVLVAFAEPGRRHRTQVRVAGLCRGSCCGTSEAGTERSSDVSQGARCCGGRDQRRSGDLAVGRHAAPRARVVLAAEDNQPSTAPLVGS